MFGAISAACGAYVSRVNTSRDISAPDIPSNIPLVQGSIHPFLRYLILSHDFDICITYPPGGDIFMALSRGKCSWHLGKITHRISREDMPIVCICAKLCSLNKSSRSSVHAFLSRGSAIITFLFLIFHINRRSGIFQASMATTRAMPNMMKLTAVAPPPPPPPIPQPPRKATQESPKASQSSHGVHIQVFPQIEFA